MRLTENPWRTVSPQTVSIAGGATGAPPVPNLPAKNNDPWAPESSTNAAASPVAAEEDEFTALSNRNTSSHQNGLCFAMLREQIFRDVRSGGRQRAFF